MQQPLSFFLEQDYPFIVTPDPDGGYFLSYPDLPGCMTQVDSASDIAAAAEDIRSLWLESAHAHNLEIPLPKGTAGYSGKFLVRVPRSLHRRLAQSAEQEGVSLNQYVVSLLTTNDALSRIERRLDGSEGGNNSSRPRDKIKRLSDRRRASLSVVGVDDTAR